MNDKEQTPISGKIKKVILGGAKSPSDPGIFHKLSLIAFFAWIGLGADGLSSSSYGPEEAFRSLGGHDSLSIFVALGTVITIFVISASYSQIIELFPHGGGGYLVASKLLSPTVGMVSGCALLIDYVLTISISIASGADAIFSFLPPELYVWRFSFAIGCLIILTVLNMRGVKESVLPLVPIFITFVLTHAFLIVYSIVDHFSGLHIVVSKTVSDVQTVSQEMGIFGLMFILMRAYSMGAGTYTGIEAVSNGLPILRDPKVKTGKTTMRYMAISLATTVFGLMIAYLLYQVVPQDGKTLNAVLLEAVTRTWQHDAGKIFLLVTLVSEAAILFVAAQAGFLDGPRVLANMAMDRWFPAKFSMLSDRLVTQNGILLMGISALLVLVLSGGSVRFLVVLYSINVFITFALSQLGMVRHWLQVRKNNGRAYHGMIVNGIGLMLTSFILVTVLVIKFDEGGWITMVITGTLVILALMIKRHYRKTLGMLDRLDPLVEAAKIPEMNEEIISDKQAVLIKCDREASTAVILVNGFNGLGLHTLFNVMRFFHKSFKNFVFVEVGAVDAGVFKGASEIEALKNKVNGDVRKYADYMRHHGLYSETFTSVGTDIVGEVEKLAPEVIKKFPNSVFFGGQLVFPENSFATRWLHNYLVFTLQRRFYQQGIPFVIMPIRV